MNYSFFSPWLFNCPRLHHTSSQFSSLLQKYKSCGKMLPSDIICTTCKIQLPGRRAAARLAVDLQQGRDPSTCSHTHLLAPSCPLIPETPQVGTNSSAKTPLILATRLQHWINWHTWPTSAPAISLTVSEKEPWFQWSPERSLTERLRFYYVYLRTCLTRPLDYGCAKGHPCPSPRPGAPTICSI